MRRRLGRRGVILCDRRKRKSERALRIDRSSDDPRERDECFEIDWPRRRVANRKTRSAEPRRKFRGRVEGQRRKSRGHLRDIDEFRRQTRRVAGRRGAEDHYPPRGAGGSGRKTEDRPHLRLRRRSAQGDGGDQRQRRIRAGRPALRAAGAKGQGLGRGRFGRYEPVPEPLRNVAEAGAAQNDDRLPGADLRQRRGFPARHRSGRLD